MSRTAAFVRALFFALLLPSANSTPLPEFQVVNAFPGLSFSLPTCLASPPGNTHQLFVCEKESGTIKVIPDVTAASPVSADFLSLNHVANFDDQGILGLAFHPNYGPDPATQNRYCYVFYSWKDGDSAYSRLSRFTVSNPDSTPSAEAASELVLIEQLDRAGFHPGGDLHFGADGYLYISLGDEGFYQDSFNNAQHIDGNFFSAIARIDVDKKPGNLEPNFHPAVPRDNGLARYSIPADNPFIDATSFNNLPVRSDQVWTEFWAVGFRHPFRFSIDAATGELWCGDVGEDAFEEIDLVTRGGNYGWSFREGTHPGPQNNLEPPGFSSLDPLYEIPHEDLPGDPNFQGDCVIGGFVYRGARIPALSGRYVFGDYITGNIWAAERTGANSIDVQRLAGQSGIAAFGSDPSNGDVLMAENDDGRILRLVALTSIESWRQKYFGTISNSGEAADTAVPDRDGIANLIKYALVLTPGTSGNANLPRAEIFNYAEGARLTLRFARDPRRDDVAIDVESADALNGPWTRVAQSVNGAAFTGAGFVGETDGADGLKLVQIATR